MIGYDRFVFAARYCCSTDRPAISNESTHKNCEFTELVVDLGDSQYYLPLKKNIKKKSNAFKALSSKPIEALYVHVTCGFILDIIHIYKYVYVRTTPAFGECERDTFS